MSDLAEMIAVYMEAVAAEAAAVTAAHAASLASFEAQVVKDTAHHARVVYLDRIRLLQTPWFGVYLHRFDGPDPRPELHDHPWPFATMVIWGGYHELRQDIGRPASRHMEHRRPFRPRRLRLTEAHTIVVLDRAGTRSVVLVGRRQREWGVLRADG